MNIKKPELEKKKFSPTKSFPNHSQLDDIPWVVLGILLILVYACSVGCVSVQSYGGDEPEWKPKVYKFDSVDAGKCLFIGDSVTDIIDLSDDNILHDYVTIRVDEFKSLMFKLQKCEVWQ